MTGCSQKPMLGSQTSTMASQRPRGSAYGHARLTPIIQRVRTNRRQPQNVGHMTTVSVTAPEPDDDDPIVVLDDELVAPSALSAAAQTYLRAQGIRDPATWEAFRIDAVTDADLARLLTPRQRSHVTSGGIWLPTFDPREPQHRVGLVRMFRAQNLHRFLTAPAGIACPANIHLQQRIVLCDNPLLGLRLHHHGLTGVAIVEDPTALSPLTDWFSTKDVVTVTTAKTGTLALPAGITAVGATRIIGRLESASDAALALLCLTREHVRLPTVAAPITLRLLRDLHIYAQARVAAGEARAALASFHVEVPDLVRAYRMGFTPAAWRGSVSVTDQRAIQGHRFGNALILPAFDENGVVVDLLVCRVAAHHVAGMWPEPRGMCAPEIINGLGSIVVTDCLPWLGRLFARGRRDVLLLRGPVDARNNLARIVAAGVRNVEVCTNRDAAAIAAIFRAAGMSVVMGRRVADAGNTIAEVPAPVAVASATMTVATQVIQNTSDASVPHNQATDVDPGALVFVDEEHDGHVAIFQAGPVRYAVTMRDDGMTQRRVVIRAHGKSCTHDVDLAVPAARDRMAGGAARQVGLSVATISAHLVGLLAGVQSREAARERGPTVVIDDAERVRGTALLMSPNLLDHVVNDLGMLGWIGEDHAKRTLYLAAISRLLPQPVWALFQAGAGAAPWHGVSSVAALTPPEACLVFHRLTEAALMQSDRASLYHRLVIVDQAEALRPEAALALRVLRERGGVGWSQVGEGGSGRGEARGPVAVLAAATGEIDVRCRDSFLRVIMDESPEQTACILAEQSKRLSHPSESAAAQVAVIARHHAAQRLLERLPVMIPFAQRIIFPATRVRHRDEQRWFLGLVAACALLHQRQRTRVDGVVVASETDFAIVQNCTAHFLGQESNGIAAASRRLLNALVARRLTTFTMADLSSVMPDWTRWTFRAALQDLGEFGHVDAGTRVNPGRGHLRHYRLITTAATAASGIRLRPVGERDHHADIMVGPTMRREPMAENGGATSAILDGVAV
jgi:hypothetical protein